MGLAQADYFDPSDKVEVKLWVLDGPFLHICMDGTAAWFPKTIQ